MLGAGRRPGYHRAACCDIRIPSRLSCGETRNIAGLGLVGGGCATVPGDYLVPLAHLCRSQGGRVLDQGTTRALEKHGLEGTHILSRHFWIATALLASMRPVVIPRLAGPRSCPPSAEDQGRLCYLAGLERFERVIST